MIKDSIRLAAKQPRVSGVRPNVVIVFSELAAKTYALIREDLIAAATQDFLAAHVCDPVDEARTLYRLRPHPIASPGLEDVELRSFEADPISEGDWNEDTDGRTISSWASTTIRTGNRVKETDKNRPLFESENRR